MASEPDQPLDLFTAQLARFRTTVDAGYFQARVEPGLTCCAAPLSNREKLAGAIEIGARGMLALAEADHARRFCHVVSAGTPGIGVPGFKELSDKGLMLMVREPGPELTADMDSDFASFGRLGFLGASLLLDEEDDHTFPRLGVMLSSVFNPRYHDLSELFVLSEAYTAVTVGVDGYVEAERYTPRLERGSFFASCMGITPPRSANPQSQLVSVVVDDRQVELDIKFGYPVQEVLLGALPRMGAFFATCAGKLG